jgi:hypothetical protein
MVNRMEVNNSLLRLVEYIKQFYARWKRYSSPGAPPPNCRHSPWSCCTARSDGCAFFNGTGAPLDTMAIEMAEDLKETKWLTGVKQLLRLTKVRTTQLYAAISSLD